MWIKKTCAEHGPSEYMIESDAVFYHSLVKNKEAYDAGGYVVEITDRCNLTCPHCYQEPDNAKQDKPTADIIAQINSFPKDTYSITLAGAEPTMRTDLAELIKEIKLLGRSVNILTNGLKLANVDYVNELIAAGCDSMTVGLNHPDYQGEKVHKRQLAGIANCVTQGLEIKNINYTLETLDQLDFILKEIQQFGNTARQYRIRGGAEIGRYPDEPRSFLSQIVYAVHRQATANNWAWEKIPGDDNLYHYMVKINGLEHRLIQWADVKTVDLDELQCGPWGSFVPGVPLTNLMHQVILRDAAVNKKQPLQDQVLLRYQR
jgi:organic radical activating enzyme